MTQPGKPITVLMAEDDSDDRLLVREAFAESGVRGELRFVEDGVELLDYLRRDGKFSDPASAPRPGLILLDLNMPRKDGREALREIQADPELRGIRVVVLTTSRAVEDVTAAYGLSAASYITKPCSYSGLSEVMRTLSKYWLEVVELPPA